MPIQFPTSPTDGQVFSGYYYDAALSAWKASPISAGPIAIADTAPAGAIHGDMWYRSNDGTTYIYYNDGSTSQWVEVRSQIATSQIGLVPITPTSISVGSGTGTVNESGIISINGATSLTVNGIFTDTYKRYKLVMSGYSSVSEWLNLRFVSSGSINSSSNYYFAGGYVNTSSMGFQTSGAPSTYGRFGYAATDGFITETDFVGVRDTDRYARTSTIHSYGTLAQTIYGSTYIVGATTFDGIQVFHATGANLNMTVRVYGYN